MRYISTMFLLLLSGCTYSVTLVHTEVQASDVVDEQQTPTATTTVDLKVPLQDIVK